MKACVKKHRRSQTTLDRITAGDPLHAPLSSRFAPIVDPALNLLHPSKFIGDRSVYSWIPSQTDITLQMKSFPQDLRRVRNLK